MKFTAFAFWIASLGVFAQTHKQIPNREAAAQRATRDQTNPVPRSDVSHGLQLISRKQTG